jgi:hypothetical protein
MEPIVTRAECYMVLRRRGVVHVAAPGEKPIADADVVYCFPTTYQVKCVMCGVSRECYEDLPFACIKCGGGA